MGFVVASIRCQKSAMVSMTTATVSLTSRTIPRCRCVRTGRCAFRANAAGCPQSAVRTLPVHRAKSVHPMACASLAAARHFPKSAMVSMTIATARSTTARGLFVLTERSARMGSAVNRNRAVRTTPVLRVKSAHQMVYARPAAVRLYPKCAMASMTIATESSITVPVRFALTVRFASTASAVNRNRAVR